MQEPPRARLVVLATLSAAALACSDAAEDRFAQVAPLVEKRCASSDCHGVRDEDAPKLSLDASRWMTFRVDGAGKLRDRAAALASIKTKINSKEGAELSTFLRKTLPVAVGGLFHASGEIFASRDSADYRRLADFAASIHDGTEGDDVPALSALEETFRDKVFPTLVQKNCATATCHGDLNFGVSIFRTPAVAGSALISRKELREAYHNARANITLWGEPLQSRLLAKMLPLEKGGIPHKGGNDTFFAAALERGTDPRQSPEVTGILEWIAQERTAALGDAPVGVSALVVVGGPLALAGPFDPPPFAPGTDLYRLDAPFSGSPAVLTAGAHDAPADVRDPAISHDGKTIVFAMRRSAADAHNLYVIGTDGTGLRQLTSDASAGPGGTTIASFQPTFGPNGGYGGPGGPAERIYFVSMRGDRSDDFRYQNADLYAINVDGSGLERLTFTCQPELRPTFLQSGEFAGTVAYTIKRAAEGGYKGVFFRFPIDHNAAFHFQPEAHPHFGMSEPPQVFYGLRELADGRSVLTLEDEGNRTRGGQLAVLERQFAVELPEGEEATATLPGFRHALTVLTPDATRAGASADGLWRDPVPLPDGSIVVAHAPGPIDLDHPPADLRTSLVRVTLESDRQSSRPRVAAMQPLAGGDRAWSQPAPVYARPTEDEPHPRAWDDTGATGRLVHSGVQVIEAVLARLVPSGPRVLRDDIAMVRAVAPLPLLAELLGKPLSITEVPAAETRDGHPHATTASLTGRTPLFAAVEVPPAADGSLAADIPAHVPVRVMTIDRRRMAVGAQQHQWYAVLPGERFPVGIGPAAFAARCGGCHGAMDGKRETVLQPPVDGVTQSSVTLSLYEGADRRRPVASLPQVGPELFVLVDFRRDVQPILDDKCVSCHAGAAPAGGLSLSSAPTRHYTDAYESLLAPATGATGGHRYVDATGLLARRSFLMETVLGEELEAARDVPAASRTVHPSLSETEVATLARWIELGAAFVGVP